VCALVGRTQTADLCDSLRSHRPLTAVCVCRIAFHLNFLKPIVLILLLSTKVEESLKEALAQLHDIEKRDMLEHKEWKREQGTNDPRAQGFFPFFPTLSLPHDFPHLTSLSLA
jgi:hypothetical protein